MTVKSQTLSPEETEKLLLAQFGTKLDPVDKAKLAKLKLQQNRANLLKANLPKHKPTIQDSAN